MSEKRLSSIRNALSEVLDATREFVAQAFRARATLLLPDLEGRLQLPASAQAAGAGPQPAPEPERGTAQWAFDHAQPAGLGTDTLPASPLFYLPLVAPMRTRGVLALLPSSTDWMGVPEQRQQLDTFATLTAIALERVHYIEVAQGALVDTINNTGNWNDEIEGTFKKGISEFKQTGTW